MSTKLTQKVVSEYPAFTLWALAISMLLLMATDSKLPLPWPVVASVRFLSIINLES